MPGKNNQHVENTTASAKTILLVEDDTIIAEFLVQMITKRPVIKSSRFPMHLKHWILSKISNRSS